MRRPVAAFQGIDLAAQGGSAYPGVMVIHVRHLKREALETVSSRTFVLAALGALLLLGALPLPPQFFGWLGPLAPNVDTGPSTDGRPPLPGPWYLSLAHLAWLAPACWVLLIRHEKLPGRRPYLALWLVGLAFWLAALYWLTFPYWATFFGWLALALYLAFYLPVFVGLSRVAVHRLHVPTIVAAPVVWTGLELARGHLVTGFTMASLGHTQYRWLELIQISDLAGAYGVGFVVMFVGACLGQMLPLEGRRWSLWPLLPAAAMLASVLAYGQWRLAASPAERADSPVSRIALVQGCIDTEVKYDEARLKQIWQQYVQLSDEAVRRFGSLDLVVWPETMFRTPLVTYDEDMAVPPQWDGTAEEFRALTEDSAAAGPEGMAWLARRLSAPLLLGVDTHHLGRDGVRHYNSAAFVSREGEVTARYDKRHPVLFGEYVPFARRFRFLQQITPIGEGLSAGTEAVAARAGPLLAAPNICYESVLPHVIRRPVLALRAEGREPDVLVNLTNDGWFYGSTELDLHLICSVFRTVECRKPMVVAANTGFSASIDGDGRIRALGPRRATATLLAVVARDGRSSWYLAHGDWLAGACLAACAALAVMGIVHRGPQNPTRQRGAR